MNYREIDESAHESNQHQEDEDNELFDDGVPLTEEDVEVAGDEAEED